MFIFPKTPPEVLEKYKMLLDSGIIVWHCASFAKRHGTIYNIKRGHVAEIYAMLVYYFGDKCAWSQKNSDNTVNLEFVYQGNGKLSRPWYYCGSTSIFNDWKEREDANLNKLSQFHLADEVIFEFRGVVRKGYIANLRKRATVVSNGQKFYIPADQLRKVTE